MGGHLFPLIGYPNTRDLEVVNEGWDYEVGGMRSRVVSIRIGFLGIHHLQLNDRWVVDDGWDCIHYELE